jgi:hypothetical protein
VGNCQAVGMAMDVNWNHTGFCTFFEAALAIMAI